MEGNGKLNLATARALTPPAFSQHAAEIREKIAELVTPEAVGKMMGAILKKAEEGDLNAARFLLDYAGCAPPKMQMNLGVRGFSRPDPAHAAPAPMTIRQPRRDASSTDDVDREEHSKEVGRTVGELRRIVARYLMKNGPTPEEKLAELFDLAESADAVLDNHPWFEKGKNGWKVTATGRKENS